MPSVGTSSGLRLGDLCKAGGITTGKTASRAQYQKAGLHLVKVGNLTGHGIEWCSVERQFVDDAFWTKHIGARLEKGDILLTAAAHGPKWIGLKVDIFEGAPPHLDQRVMCCGELMDQAQARLRHRSVLPAAVSTLTCRVSGNPELHPRPVRPLVSSGSVRNYGA